MSVLLAVAEVQITRPPHLTKIPQTAVAKIFKHTNEYISGKKKKKKKKKILKIFTISFLRWFGCFNSTHLGNSCVAHTWKIFSSEWKFGIRQQCRTEHSNCWSFYGLFSLFELKYLLSYDSEFLEEKCLWPSCIYRCIHHHYIGTFLLLLLIFLTLFGALGIRACNCVQQVSYYLIGDTFINNFSTQST